jgi:hypothetical protein
MHNVSLGELHWILRRVIPAIHSFQGRKGSFDSKEPYLAKWKKHRYFSKENHPCLKHEHLAHCFPVRIALVWKRILPATTVFQGGNSLSMLQIGLFT